MCYQGGCQFSLAQFHHCSAMRFFECLGCRVAMSLTRTEDEYPGYQRGMFECPVCGETMTQWAAVSLGRGK